MTFGTIGLETSPPETASSPGLSLERIVKDYGAVRAVAGVDLDVREGEFLTVLGPSGSGKTTVLRLVAGFLPLTAGRILLAGRDVSGMTPAERGIGMVFQSYALFPHLTARDNVAYGLKVRKWRKPERYARAEEMLRVVGLEGMEGRLPSELSGGQQQRVALARALAFEPGLLLMDEPLGALDRELRVHMAGELRRIQQELKTTVMYVTHDREEALTLSDRIAVMRAGTLEAVGTPQGLYNRPETRFVASFFGGHNLLPCEVVGPAGPGTEVRVRCLGQELAAMRSPRVVPGSEGVCLAVPGIGFAVVPRDHGGAIAGRVYSAVYMGNEIQVTCKVENPLTGEVHTLRLDLPGGVDVPPPVGAEVALTIRPEVATVVAE